MWIELIRGLLPDAEFKPPAHEAAIVECEQSLGHSLGGDLRSLLRETNGVSGQYELGLVWAVERIGADNVMFRSSPELAAVYMPFEPLLFFADAGNGDQFAQVMRGGQQDVFVWDHETDSRTWVAPRITEYLIWWIDGRLRV